jgi:dTDP-4-dehydrorhamnose 3,5-epimerase
MRIIETPLPGLVILEPHEFTDARGSFCEVWNAREFQRLGLPERFVQDNQSVSFERVLRGLHAQLHYPQGKLVRVLAGEVYDVAVDMRPLSPSFGRWHGISLDPTSARQVYIPPGFAHGFCVVKAPAVFAYKCTGYYMPGDEFAIRWDDPELGIDWPEKDPVMSEKDLRAMSFKAAVEMLPKEYGEAKGDNMP